MIRPPVEEGRRSARPASRAGDHCCKRKSWSQLGTATRRLIGGVTLWELTWKFLAVRRARELKLRKWVLPLLLINSGGVLPIGFLMTHKAPNR